MKTRKSLNLALILTLTCLLNGLFPVHSLAQTPTAEQPNYLLREFMKVEPGQEEEYLKVEKLWKKVHQRRIAEGKIVAWTLSRRVFFGTDAPYDYVTTTVFKSGKELDEVNKMNWDYITKGMTPDEIALANKTDKTRKMVSSQLVYQLERVQPEEGNNRYWKMTQLKAHEGKGAELEKHEKFMRPVFEEACKSGDISGWRFAKNLFPRAADGGTYYRGIVTKNMDDMLKAESNAYISKAFKKVYPDKDWTTYSKTIGDIITILDIEMMEIVDKGAN